MSSVLRVNRWLVSCKYIDVLFHMLLGLASIVLTLFMQLAPVTYASTGAIFQRVGDIALAPLKSSYLIEDKTLFEWALSLSASPLSSGSSGGDGDDGNNENDDGNEPEPLNVVYGKEIWLAQVLAERLLSKTLKNKRRLLKIVHKKLQRAIAEGNSGLVKILGDRLMLIEVELDELERSGQQLDPVVLSRIRAAFVSDQQELQDYDDRSLRLALPEHPVTVDVDPDSLIIRLAELNQQQMRFYLQWLYSAAGLLYSELKQQLLRQLRRAASYSESHLVAVDSLLIELQTCVRQFRSLKISGSPNRRIGYQVPNSDTQTNHSEKPSASQPSGSQTSTSRQAPISGSGLSERRYARCLDGDDGGSGNPFHNGHTGDNHCPMCNNGPCEKRVDDNLPANIAATNQRFRNALSLGRAKYPDDIMTLPNHTYKPYVWISHAANKAMNEKYKDKDGPTSNNPEVIRQLLLSERKAKKDFLKRLEYRLVNYGYDLADDAPVRNYGVFAKEPIKEGDILGIYSGVIYLSTNTDYVNVAGIQARKSDPKGCIQKMLQFPDFMSYCRTHLQALGNGGNKQRTPEKYKMDLSKYTGFKLTQMLPDNERYTPMHFVNSADSIDGSNAQYFMFFLKIDSCYYMVPALIATRAIELGEELLADYLVAPDEVDTAKRTATAQHEKKLFEAKLKDMLDFVSETNRLGIEIPTYVDAPVHYLPEDLRKALKKERKALQEKATVQPQAKNI